MTSTTLDYALSCQLDLVISKFEDCWKYSLDHNKVEFFECLKKMKIIENLIKSHLMEDLKNGEVKGLGLKKGNTVQKVTETLEAFKHCNYVSCGDFLDCCTLSIPKLEKKVDKSQRAELREILSRYSTFTESAPFIIKTNN